MKPFHCLHCGAEFGQTDGISLIIGQAIFRLRVTMTCAVCGALRKWKPVEVDYSVRLDQTIAISAL